MQPLHGILSLMLITIAVMAALVYLFFTSTTVGSIYLILVLTASLSILYAYCAKCTTRDRHCGHIFPGKLTRWLPQRQSGPYSFVDLLVTAGSLTLIFLFPQYWLLHNQALLFVFWGLTIVALAEILLRVCRDCRNQNCMLCKNKGL